MLLELSEVVAVVEIKARRHQWKGEVQEADTGAGFLWKRSLTRLQT